VTEPVLLSYGQLSVWRDVRDLDASRRHEANTRSIWALHERHEATSHTVAEVEQALFALGRRHESLRTVYDLSDSYAPTQRVLTSGEVESGVFECALDESAAFDAYIERLAAQPFDLATEPSWRFRVATQGGHPYAAIVIKHHITADGWSDDALRREFQALLRSGAGPNSPAAPPTPRELARWQRTGAGAARAGKLRAHWEEVFGLTAASLRRGEAGTGVGDATEAEAPGDAAFQCVGRSRAAHDAATRLAQRLSVPLSSVVLSAFVRSVARRAGSGALLAQLMSSNRFVPPWSSVVTSMNQWTAVALEAPDGDFGAFVRHVHSRSLSAYRHGMYDVDEIDVLRDKVRAGREPYEATCAYNFLTAPAPAPAADHDGTAEAEPEIGWEAPFSRIGHPCYLRATDVGGDVLELRLRTLGLTRSLTGDLLADVFTQLIDAVS